MAILVMAVLVIGCRIALGVLATFKEENAKIDAILAEVRK
jgi:hypothetical protein